MKKILTPLLLSLTLSAILPVENVYAVKIGDDTQAVSEQPHAGKFTVFNAQDLEAEIDAKRHKDALPELFKDFAISDDQKADALTTFFTQRNLIDAGFAAISYDDLNNQQASLETVYNATKSSAFAAFLKRQNFPQVSEQDSAVIAGLNNSNASVVSQAEDVQEVGDTTSQKVKKKRLGDLILPHVPGNNFRQNLPCLAHLDIQNYIEVTKEKIAALWCFGIDPNSFTPADAIEFISKNTAFSHNVNGDAASQLKNDTAFLILCHVDGINISWADFLNNPIGSVQTIFNILCPNDPTAYRLLGVPKAWIDNTRGVEGLINKVKKIKF